MSVLPNVIFEHFCHATWTLSILCRSLMDVLQHNIFCLTLLFIGLNNLEQRPNILRKQMVSFPNSDIIKLF